MDKHFFWRKKKSTFWLLTNCLVGILSVDILNVQHFVRRHFDCSTFCLFDIMSVDIMTHNPLVARCGRVLKWNSSVGFELQSQNNTPRYHAWRYDPLKPLGSINDLSCLDIDPNSSARLCSWYRAINSCSRDDGYCFSWDAISFKYNNPRRRKSAYNSNYWTKNNNNQTVTGRFAHGQFAREKNCPK